MIRAMLEDLEELDRAGAAGAENRQTVPRWKPGRYHTIWGRGHQPAERRRS